MYFLTLNDSKVTIDYDKILADYENKTIDNSKKLFDEDILPALKQLLVLHTSFQNIEAYTTKALNFLIDIHIKKIELPPSSVISYEEIKELAEHMRNTHDVDILTDLSMINILSFHTDVAFYNIISLPIDDDSDIVSLYKIRSLPDFTSSSKLFPLLNNDNVAYYYYDDKYVTISEQGLYNCLNSNSNCYSNDPVMDYDVEQCGISSFYTSLDKNICEYLEVPNTQPEFIIIDSTVFFSVGPTNITITVCKKFSFQLELSYECCPWTFPDKLQT